MESNEYNSNIRILPDICVLISHTLSRLIELNILEGFEIMIPDSIEYIVQTLCEGRLQAGFYNEIDKLKELETERKIDIVYCSYEMPEIKTKKELVTIEDDLILEIAIITNSILFTSDKGLRNKASSVKQPVIYFPAKYQKNIKDISSDF
jgi:predicted PilT family ATPase